MKGDGRGKGSTDDKWKMLKAFVYPFIPVLVKRRIISYPDEFFLSIRGCVDRVCATVLFKCSYFSSEAPRTNVGRDFLSLTVIMQLVFECSYHTNVDRLHFQSCVPGFLSVQYNSFHLFFFFSNVCPQPSGSQCAAHFLVSCASISEADVGIWV